MKDQVATRGPQQVAITLEGTRVSVEIFVRGKLQAVDEDARHHRAAGLPGALDQREVAGVQVAHGGYEGCASSPRQGLPQLGNGVDDAHMK